MAMLLFSCVKEVSAPKADPRPESSEEISVLRDTDFYGIIDNQNISWIEDSDVTVYDGVGKEPLIYEVSEVLNDTIAILKGQIHSDADLFFGLYPSDYFTDLKDGIATMRIPSEQLLWGQTADNAAKATPSVAMTYGNTFKFKSVSSFLSFDLIAEDVKSIRISAKNNCCLAGTADIIVYDQTVVSVDGTSDIVLKPYDAVFEPGVYKVSVLPGKYDGFTVTMTFDEGNDYSHTLDACVEAKIGGVVEIGTIHSDIVSAPVVKTGNVAFSCAEVSWQTEGDVLGYNVYVSGNKINAELLPPTTLSYHVTGLPTAFESNIEVESVGARDSKRTSVTVKTASLKVIDKGEHHVTIEWDDLMNRPLTGSGDGRNNGYMIGVYTDKACTNKVYELVPYDGVANSDYMMGNSSYLGKVGDKNYYVPTKLALGSLNHSTTYYIRIRTLDKYEYVYNSTTYTLSSKYGNSEWSDPVEVRTLSDHVASDNEVIFENFDQMSCQFDRFKGICGTFTSNYLFGSVDDLRVQMPKTEGKSVRGCGFSTALTGTEGDYLSGSKFTSFGTSYAQSVGKAGYSFEGWHFVDGDCIRPAMGAIYIDAAQKRFVGTPLLERNLSDTEKECVLTFNMATLRKSNNYDIKNEYVFVRRIRKIDSSWEQTQIKEIPVSTQFEGTPTKTDYRPAFGKSQTYTVELDLKKGDVVAIVAHNAASGILVILDDILIVTK